MISVKTRSIRIDEFKEAKVYNHSKEEIFCSPHRKTERLSKASETYKRSLKLNPFLWSSFESLCHLGEYYFQFTYVFCIKILRILKQLKTGSFLMKKTPRIYRLSSLSGEKPESNKIFQVSSTSPSLNTLCQTNSQTPPQIITSVNNLQSGQPQDTSPVAMETLVNKIT